MYKDILGYEGLYQISNLGDIKSLKFGKEKILKSRKQQGGYLKVCLYKNGKTKELLVHRLIGQAFLGLDINNNEKCICHKNDIGTDNRLANLFVGTYKDNSKDMVKKGRHGRQGKLGINSPCSKKVLQKTLKGTFIKLWHSMSDVTRALNINQSCIFRCCNGKYKTAGGYRWEYS